MSLWYKDMSAVTFADVTAFCSQKLPEGERLDYKSDFPTDLGKLVCAFANTRGGMILIGIAADKTNNLPIWPPHGFLQPPGVEERIVAICRDQIYPPIRPLISPVLENPSNPETSLVVVRVNESPETPHSIKGKVYVRTGSQVHPYGEAHIDHIERMLRKRGKVEEQREQFLQQEIGRALRKMAYSRLSMPDVPHLNSELMMSATVGRHGRPLLPVRWASVIPLFPWDELCDFGICFGMLRIFDGVEQIQRAPGGAFGFGIKPGVEENPGFIKDCASLSTKGHVFGAQIATETADHVRNAAITKAKVTDLFIGKPETEWFLYQTLRNAKAFYQHAKVQRPGFLQVSLGLVDVFHFRMTKMHNMGTGRPFVDVAFRTETIIPIEVLQSDVEDAAQSVLRDLALGFDVF